MLNVATTELVNVAIESIVIVEGMNKRTDFGDMQEFSESIKHNGLQVPLSVRRVEDKFTLVAGHRRLAACKMLGLKEVPCLVKTMTDEEEAIAHVVENLARKDLNPVEEGETLYALSVSLGKKGKPASPRELSKHVGKNHVTITARLKLGTASDALKDAVKSGKLDATRADKLIKEDKDTLGHIATAMIEYADSMANRSEKRKETIAKSEAQPEKVETAKVDETTPTPTKVTENTTEEATQPDPVANETVANETVIPEPVTNEDLLDSMPVAQVKVRPKREVQMLRVDSAMAVLEDGERVMKEAIKSETDPERKAFLKGVVYGYRTMLGLDTDPSTPDEWDLGL